MKKKLHIEFLRVVAIFFVIFNHTGDSGYQLYISAESTVKYLLYGMLSSLCKVAVPLFFMISGALLLGKEESIQDVWKKRIAKMAIILVVISLFYYIRQIGFDFTKFDILLFIQGLYTDSMSYHLWYLYAYLAFLILLPFLRKLVKTMDEQEFKYLMILALIFTVVRGMIAAISGNNLNSWITLFVLSDVVFFPIMGYYIEQKWDKLAINGKKAGICSVAVIGACFLGIFCTRMHALRIGDVTSEGYLNAFCCVSALSIYILAKYFFEKMKVSVMLERAILFFGELTFGVYLFEVAVREWIYGPIFSLIVPYLKTLLSSLVVSMCCLLVGSVLVWLLKRIPFIRKYI